MMDKNKIFKIIQEDLGKIDNQESSRNGSRKLWKELNIQYSMMLPEVVKHIRTGGKVMIDCQEADYRPELRELKSALLTWIVMNEDEIIIDKAHIDNEAQDLISKQLPSSTEEELKTLITESKVYISKNSFREKLIGIEKLWDAFERLKTIISVNKKNSVENLISHVSGDDEGIRNVLEQEFRELTCIGNSYSIRHHETDQKTIPNKHYVEYLYFRLLSLVSSVINLMDIKTINLPKKK